MPEPLAPALLGALLAAGAAAGGDVVLLSQREVPQYAQVVEAFRAQAPAATLLDVADPAAAAALARGAAPVVVAVGSRAFELARASATASAVIAAGVLAPDPGGRRDVTAVPMEARASDALGALRALAPNVRRVLALHPPGAAALVAEARAAARQSGLEISFVELPDLEGFQGRFRGLVRGQDAAWILPDARLARPELVKFMVAACLEERIALVGFLEGMTRAGALLSVSADFGAIGREAARLAAEVAARPPEQRTGIPFRFVRGRITVNDRTREALSLAGRPPPEAEVVR